MADPRTVLGSTACAWAGGELVATGRLGLLVAGDDHVIVRDAVPVSIPRAGLRIVERRTTGWWNGIAVDVVRGRDGGLSLFGTVSRDGPPLPTGVEEERGRFTAHGVDGSALVAIRSFTDELRFDASCDEEALGPFAGEAALRSFDVVPTSSSAPLDGVVVGLDGTPAAPGTDRGWRRQLGEHQERPAERLRSVERSVLTAVSSSEGRPGGARAFGEFWVDDQVDLFSSDTSGFVRTADVTRRWDSTDGLTAILAGTYLHTADGWFPGTIGDGQTVLHVWSPTAPDPSWTILSSDVLTERSRADKRIARDAVDRHLTIRTTARVGDVSVIVDEPWNVEQSATLEVLAADGRARAVRAEDGATLRFVRRGDRATARVRPTDLVGLESDVVGSDGTRTHPSAGPGRR